MKVHFYLFLIIGLTSAFSKAEAQVKYKQHEFDFIGDFRTSQVEKIFGTRISFPIIHKDSKLLSGHDCPVQIYTGIDYSNVHNFNYSFGIRFIGWRRSLDKTLYLVEDLHFRTAENRIDSFDKGEPILSAGGGYKLKPNLGIEYLIQPNFYIDYSVHNFAVAQTVHFETKKRQWRKSVFWNLNILD